MCQSGGLPGTCFSELVIGIMCQWGSTWDCCFSELGIGIMCQSGGLPGTVVLVS
jgi:hypothetical protein